MTTPATTEVKDRILAALVYILPLIYALPFGVSLLKQIPFLGLIYLPLSPLISLYYSLPFAGLIIFFVLFFAVVRNERVSRFIRFNTLQAILIDIALILCGLILPIFGQVLAGENLLVLTLNNTVFLGTLTACIFGIIQSARGFYAEIPAISEAVYAQLPW
ncbi:conserved hypothetical protein [Gloeothece citriformis PCC 7424]|uniref:Tic20 family protein n=1 Tax=Gloeothece citriformis (strain PCC 7424) TaxID=65393 RepID=B7KEW9_GLOC7|nr:Tic20 family protein [Gloeothece citriformis]ACK70425.1 conserved hypothetical protein [Gloeothece citriformis PCC 7424]